MFLLGPGMQRIYELLALIVALYFPFALLTWLVIDKLFSTAEGEGQAMRRQTGRSERGRAFPDRSQPGA